MSVSPVCLALFLNSKKQFFDSVNFEFNYDDRPFY